MILQKAISHFSSNHYLFVVAFSDDIVQVESRWRVNNLLEWVIFARQTKEFCSETDWSEKNMRAFFNEQRYNEYVESNDKRLIAYLKYAKYNVQGEMTCSLSDNRINVPKDTAMIGSLCGNYLLIENRHRLTPDLACAYVVPCERNRECTTEWLKQNTINTLHSILHGGTKPSGMVYADRMPALTHAQ